MIREICDQNCLCFNIYKGLLLTEKEVLPQETMSYVKWG